MLGFCPLPRVNVAGDEFLPIDECQNMLDNGDNLAKEMECLKRVQRKAEDLDKKKCFEENEK